MPVVHLQINVDLSQEQKNKILLDTSQLVAVTMNKPLVDVMVIFSHNELMLGGKSGLSIDRSKRIYEGLYRLLHEVADLKSSRIYINSFEVSPIYAWHFKNDVAVCAGQNTVQNK